VPKTASLDTSPSQVLLTLTPKALKSRVAEKATGKITPPSPSGQLFANHRRLHRGKAGAEMDDYGYTFTNSRRRSNSSTQALGDFKTKFEAVDQDPVFEEELHGPSRTDTDDSNTLEKEESTDTSTLAGSVEGDEGAKKI
jgi:hypothetical protein